MNVANGFLPDFAKVDRRDSLSTNSSISTSMKCNINQDYNVPHDASTFSNAYNGNPPFIRPVPNSIMPPNAINGIPPDQWPPNHPPMPFPMMPLTNNTVGGAPPPSFVPPPFPMMSMMNGRMPMMMSNNANNGAGGNVRFVPMDPRMYYMPPAMKQPPGFVFNGKMGFPPPHGMFHPGNMNMPPSFMRPIYPATANRAFRKRPSCSTVNEKPVVPVLSKSAQALQRTRELTKDIKDLIISELSGRNENVENWKSNADYLSAAIDNGRCSFTKSFNNSETLLRRSPHLADYQIASVHWMHTLQKGGFNCMLSDDMGLGKSIEAIAFIDYGFYTGLFKNPIIISCPTGLIDNWKSECETRAPDMNVLIYYGSQDERRRMARRYGRLENVQKYEDESDSLSDSDCDSYLSDESDESDDSVEDEDDDVESSLDGDADDASANGADDSSSSSVQTKECASTVGTDEGSTHIDNEVSEKRDNGEIPNIPFHIILTSHQMLATKMDLRLFFRKYVFDMLIVDEAHSLKNSESLRYRRMRNSVRSKRRVLLTGTPVQNKIRELQNLFSFLSPYLNETELDINLALEEYVEQYQSATASQVDDMPSKKLTKSIPSPYERKAVQFFQEILAPLILRRLKNEVITNFVKKTSVIEQLTMTEYQKNLYESERSIGDVTESSLQQTKHKALLFRLRRICNHPVLLDKIFDTVKREALAGLLQKHSPIYAKMNLKTINRCIKDWCDFDIHIIAKQIGVKMKKYRIPSEIFRESCKTQRLLEIVQEQKKDNHKTLVFSQYTTFLDVIQECFSLFAPDLKYVRLDGSIAAKERSAIIKQFTETDIDVFLLSTKAAGVGLNLVSSQTVVLMDQDWNPHNDSQAEARVHRIGQKENVTVYRLYCKDTFEEQILHTCREKLKLDEAFGGATKI